MDVGSMAIQNLALLKPHHRIIKCHNQYTHWRVKRFCRDAVAVFLQPRPTGLWNFVNSSREGGFLNATSSLLVGLGGRACPSKFIYHHKKNLCNHSCITRTPEFGLKNYVKSIWYIIRTVMFVWIVVLHTHTWICEMYIECS